MRKKNKKSFRVNVHKRAIGIDVSKDFVSIVRLERNGERIILTGCGRTAINKETGGDNEIRDFKSFANAVIKTKLTGFPRHCEAGMCFCSSPELLQILNLPDSSPDAARKFIQDEIKQYAVLPLKNVQIDYCGLRGGEQKSVLVGASQIEPLTLAAKELEKKNIGIQFIEPAVVSLVRACYNKVIKPAANNIMLVLLHDENMSLCVFSGQKFDFLRTKKFDFNISTSIEQTGAIAEQIESIVQFYELERTAKQKDWPVFLTGSFELSKAKEIAQQLKNHIHRQNIEITAIDASHLDIICQGEISGDFSAVAAGAAMKLLDVNDSAININLLPKEISEIRKSRRQLVVMANIAAVILLFIFVYMGFLSKKSTTIRNELSRKTQIQSNVNISQLIRAQADVNDRTAQITSNINTLKNMFKDKTWRNWAFILAEVSTKAPSTVQIREMRARDSSTVQIQGLAVNYNAVNDFVDRLTSCKTISSAQLADAKQNTQYSYGFVDYMIICSLEK